MAIKLLLLAIMAVSPTPLLATAGQQSAAAFAAANPIRKVVTMLQKIQKKVEAEGAAEKALYDKFMCYCETGGKDLSATIDGANTKIPNVASDIKAAEELKVQTAEELKQAQVDRDDAKAAMAEATAIREKEAAAFAASKEEFDTNIAALEKAYAAVDKGMAGAFLQTTGAQVLKRLVLDKQDMLDGDRQTIVAFLASAQGTDYAPQSGQITGILKEMDDEMTRDLAAETATENAAIKTFEALMAAKTKLYEALSAAIEAKTVKVGELSVSIVQMKNDLSDTQEALAEDQKFLKDLEKNCATKTAEWEERSKTRTEELTALAETIKILNDDDALELFKKTLPGASASFVQVGVSTAALQKRALAAVHEARRVGRHPHRAQLDLLALALTGKKVNFSKVLKMIDNMVALLKTEQLDDNHKKEYCEGQFDTADDKKKALEKSLSDTEAAIATTEEGIATTADEIAALQAGIKALDKSVAEATVQRKEENEDYKALMSSNTAAKDIIEMARNRLNKFYNPKLYKPPAKEELTRQDRIVANLGGAMLVQVSAHTQRKDAPPPPPDTWNAYAKKSGESTGVIAMIDLLVKELDTEMTEATTQEKEDQKDYEDMMNDSAQKRALDSRTLTDKVATKAALEGDLSAHNGAKADTGKELMATLEYIASLHTECDWLLEYFEVRKSARTGEIDSLKNAKAVLSGADFSLLQTKARGFLGRHEQ